jgi:phosphohistidine phosphatase
LQIFLIRHAKALDAEGFSPDRDRALAARGRKDALKVGRALADLDVHFDAIASSPLVRAVETASAIAIATGYEEALTIDPRLTPEGNPRAMRALIDELRREHSSIALVGHEPSIGALLSALLGKSHLSMGKGVVINLKLKRDEELARLEWTLGPKALSPSRDLP